MLTEPYSYKNIGSAGAPAGTCYFTSMSSHHCLAASVSPLTICSLLSGDHCTGNVVLAHEDWRLGWNRSRQEIYQLQVPLIDVS